jgi:hypothetical protein
MKTHETENKLVVLAFAVMTMCIVGMVAILIMSRMIG